jgi:hypothetical protein
MSMLIVVASPITLNVIMLSVVMLSFRGAVQVGFWSAGSVAEPSPQHPKVKSSSPAIAAGNMSLPVINATLAKLS